MPGVPRKARADNSAVPRPGRLRSDRQQPMARSAGADRHADRTSWRTTRQRMGETFCRPTSSRISHRRPIRTRDIPSRRVCCRPACRGGPGPAPHQPWPYIPPPNSGTAAAATRRRGYRRRRIRMRGRRRRSRRAGRPIHRPSSPGPTVRRLRPAAAAAPGEHRRLRHQPQASGASLRHVRSEHGSVHRPGRRYGGVRARRR